MAKGSKKRWNKSVFMGTDEDIHKAYDVLAAEIFKYAVKSWRKGKTSTENLKKIHNYLYEENFI